MKAIPISMMTNRELYNVYETEKGLRRYEALTEMTKRINRKMITNDVVSIFKQYKLNSAGMERK